MDKPTSIRRRDRLLGHREPPGLGYLQRVQQGWGRGCMNAASMRPWKTGISISPLRPGSDRQTGSRPGRDSWHHVSHRNQGHRDRAGHNGLTAAFYLARSDMCFAYWNSARLSEVARSPKKSTRRGRRVAACPLHPTWSACCAGSDRDLELGRHGLKMIVADPFVQVAFEDGSVLPWWHDRQRTHQELCRFSRKDADAFSASMMNSKRSRVICSRFEPRRAPRQPASPDCWNCCAWAMFSWSERTSDVRSGELPDRQPEQLLDRDL